MPTYAHLFDVLKIFKFSLTQRFPRHPICYISTTFSMIMSINNISSPLVDEFAAAKHLGISVSTLRRDRVLPKPTIPVIYIGASVRYSIEALNKWIQRCMEDENDRPKTEISTAATPPSGIKRQRGRPRKVDYV